MRQDEGDEGSDQPTNNSDDALLAELFEDEALKFTKPRNVVHMSMPSPPPPLALPSATIFSRGGADSGSDGPGEMLGCLLRYSLLCHFNTV